MAESGLRIGRIGLEAGPLSQWLRVRMPLLEKAISIENDIRGLLRNFGHKVDVVRAAKFEARVRELADGMPELNEFIVNLLAARRTLRDGLSRLHGKVLAIAGNDTACARLMTIPGVGAVTAPTFISTIDIPVRFRNSRSVGPALGLTPVLRQSGER
ncbi:MAG: IS110 family transposase [Rhodobacteraceae bacterium]|nr:IS110 family transposase [Paracoccaceae bacterium]